ncbi:MAG TPA: hypothetical protein V6D10_17720 [Trichocoleus sp.]|jgi:hypothetical protein
MRYKILSDPDERVVCINNKLTDKTLHVGLVYLEAGLPEAIALQDPITQQTICTVQIPSAFQKIRTVAAEVEIILDINV